MTQKLTILFDLDGTIVNTAPDLMAAHNHVMRKFGYEEKKMADIKTLAGKGAWVMMQRSFKEEITDQKIKKMELKSMEDQLNSEKFLLTSELIKDRNDELDIYRDEIFTLQNKYFGVNGNYINQKKRLIKPNQLNLRF